MEAVGFYQIFSFIPNTMVLFRRIPHTIPCDAMRWRSANVLHGASSGAVPPLRVPQHMEEDLSHVQGNRIRHLLRVHIYRLLLQCYHCSCSVLLHQFNGCRLLRSYHQRILIVRLRACCSRVKSLGRPATTPGTLHNAESPFPHSTHPPTQMIPHSSAMGRVTWS